MSVATDGGVEARDFHYSHAHRLTESTCVIRVKGAMTIKRYVDLLETKFVAIGLDPALMARGPTAAVLGLAVSALTYLFRKTAPP